jgi:MoaA/NifB/PqqE/SkfB family radical SAM enzyme
MPSSPVTDEIWFSAATGIVAVRTPAGVRVYCDGVPTDLTGTLADEFLDAFRASTSHPADRLEALARLGGRRYEALHRAAAAGGAQPWQPLAAWGTLPILFLEVIGRCNERCAHCYAGSAPDVGEQLDRETCLKVIAEAARLGFKRLQLTGGDPLLCPFLVELAQAGRAAGLAQIECYTNGLALTPDRLEGLADAGVDFAFSFYSHLEATHDAMTRVPGSQQRTAAAIAAAVRRGLRVRAAIVVTEASLGEVAETRRYLEGLGVAPEAISVDRVRRVGRGVEVPGSAAEVAAPPSHAGTAASLDGVHVPGKLCVAYTGRVYPCIFARSMPLGDIRTESLGVILDRVRANARARPGDLAALSERLACLDCRLTSMMLGPAT